MSDKKSLPEIVAAMRSMALANSGSRDISRLYVTRNELAEIISRFADEIEAATQGKEAKQ